MKTENNNTTGGENTGICANCGADKGLHHYETMQCPLYGREETRFDKLNNRFYPQLWEETVFEDKGIKDYETVAINSYDKLQEDNKALLSALKDADRIIKYLLLDKPHNFYENLEMYEAAIKQAETK